MSTENISESVDVVSSPLPNIAGEMFCWFLFLRLLTCSSPAGIPTSFEVNIGKIDRKLIVRWPSPSSPNRDVTTTLEAETPSPRSSRRVRQRTPPRNETSPIVRSQLLTTLDTTFGKTCHMLFSGSTRRPRRDDSLFDSTRWHSRPRTQGDTGWFDGDPMRRKSNGLWSLRNRKSTESGAPSQRRYNASGEATSSARRREMRARWKEALHCDALRVVISPRGLRSGQSALWG
ncbi:hypothetical protein IWZ00DRAFT_9460 [Phyllosticta capitalensis]